MMKSMLTNIIRSALLLSALLPQQNGQAKAQAPTLSPSPPPTVTLSDEPSDAPSDSPTKPPPSITVDPSKMEHGKRGFSVDFYLPFPNTSNWIGIFKRSDSSFRDDLLWSNMCGEQDKKKKGGKGGKGSKKSKYCPPQDSGTVEFDTRGPDLNSKNYMPLNPGKYKACLMEYKYVRILCTNFQIEEIPRRVIEQTKLTVLSANDETQFGYGQGASVEYSSPRKLPANAWIGVYYASKVDNSSGRLPEGQDEHAWAYAGCNNKYGDNREQESCNVRERFGTVDNFYGVIPVGTHRFCLSFYSNSPYTAFSCSTRFSVVAPRLDIPSFIPFGSDINLMFRNEFPTKFNWVAILDSKNKEELWASMCGDHDSWNKGCPAKRQGTVTFSGTDPDQESYKKWPINPGQKTVCMYGVPKDHNLKLVCKNFIVRGIPDSVIAGTSLATSSNRYEFKKAIIARFNTPTAYPNTWIGVYSASDISRNMSKLPDKKPKLWVYSSCNNKDGDQNESDACMEKKQFGEIKINFKDKYWPVDPGTYYLCMSFYNNPPYTKFKCTETSFFVEPPKCEDDPDFRFTLLNRVTRVDCKWLKDAATQEQIDNRYNKWCGRNSEVRKNCRVSCDDCPVCKNQESYTWKVFDNSRRDCGYIEDETITQTQADNRLDRWCNPSRGDNKLLQCPKACGECIVPTPSPTPEPECKDDDTFKFEIYNKTMQGCGYIYESGISQTQIDNRLNKWCDASRSDNIRVPCRLTCGLCTIATIDPTKFPSAAPSVTSSVGPSGALGLP